MSDENQLPLEEIFTDEQIMGDIKRPATGSEDLSQIHEIERDSVRYTVSVEQIPLEFTTPKVNITTNIPTTEFNDVSLSDKVPCVGLSSHRNTQNREQLKGAVARVIVSDYEGVGRVITVNSPAPEKSHRAADALSHVVATDVEGNIYFGGVVADGNSSVWIKENFVEAGHKVLKKQSGQALIEAAASPLYADIAARNAFRLPAYIGRTEYLADKLVAHTDRNPDYYDAYGGSTVQMVVAKIADNSEMIIEALNLGLTDDLGELVIPDATGKQAKVANIGNEQDLSFEGRLSEYSPAKLKKTLNQVVRPLGIIQVSCDGIGALPQTLANGMSLEELVSSEPEKIINYLEKGVVGKGKDDDSLLIFVPNKEKPLASAATVELETVETIAPSSAEDEEENLDPGPDDEVVYFDADEIDNAREVDEPPKALEVQAIINDLLERYAAGENISVEEIAAAVGYRLPNLPEAGTFSLTKEQEDSFKFFEKIVGEDLSKLSLPEALEKVAAQVGPHLKRLGNLYKLLDNRNSGKKVTFKMVEGIVGYKKPKE